MAAKKDALQKIVALKRQSAEQHVRLLQLEVERIEVSISALAVSLRSMDEGKAGIDAHRLAEANGYVGKVIKDIGARQAELSRKQSELHEAREALKRVFHSQERLGEVFPSK
jgi:HPt (histidine-containing phosphotransfer) domain-containing protein